MQTIFEITTFFTRDFQAEIARMATKASNRIVQLIYVVVIDVFGVVLTLCTEDMRLVSVPIAVGGVWYLVNFVQAEKRYLKNMIEINRRVTYLRVWLYETHFESETEYSRASGNYAAILSIAESERAIVLYLGEGNYFLDKEGLPKGTAEEMSAFLRARCTCPYKYID